MRLILEPEIAASAAAHATPENKAELQTLCNEVEQLCLNGGDHTPKDIAFHTCIARCSQNRVMEMLVPIINTAVTTFASLTHRSLRRETIQTHRAITDAIVAGDAVGARCAMVMHLTYNRQNYGKSTRISCETAVSAALFRTFPSFQIRIPNSRKGYSLPFFVVLFNSLAKIHLMYIAFSPKIC